MKWTVVKVRKALGGKLIGKLFMREMVCTTLLLLPQNILENVCATVWFISSPEDAWAFSFRGSEIRNRSLVILSDELFLQEEKQIRYTILHEVAHIVLNHRNSIGYEQTETEIDQQEDEADRFAKNILSQQ